MGSTRMLFRFPNKTGIYFAVTCLVLLVACSPPADAGVWTIKVKVAAFALDLHSAPEDPALIVLRNREFGGSAPHSYRGQIERYGPNGKTKKIISFDSSLAGLSDVAVLSDGDLVVIASRAVHLISLHGIFAPHQNLIFHAYKPIPLSTGQTAFITPDAVGAAEHNIYVRGVSQEPGIWRLDKNIYGKWDAVAVPPQDARHADLLFTRDYRFAGGLFQIHRGTITFDGPNDGLEAKLTQVVRDACDAHTTGQIDRARKLTRELETLTKSKARTPFHTTAPKKIAEWRVRMALADLKFRVGKDYDSKLRSCCVG